MEIDMKDLLEQEFSDDPVYREIHINHLEGFLYNEKILSMHPETTYSTVETGQIIGRKDSTIRNYFRTELLDYINPEKNGKFYRLNYISVFKLHMLSLLVDKAGKSTADICFFLGITPLVGAGGNNHYGNSTSNVPSVDNLRLQEDITQIKQLMVLQSLKTNLSDHKSNLLHLQLQLSNNNIEINTLKKDLELMEINHQNKVLEDKYYRVLDYSLKNTVTKKEEQKSLFKRLFKGPEGSTEEEIDQVIKNARAEAEKEKLEIAAQEKNELLKQIEEKEKMNESLQKEIDEKQREITQIESQILYLDSNPDELKRATYMNFLHQGSSNEI